MEREACVCDHGYERSDLCAEIIIIIINNNGSSVSLLLHSSIYLILYSHYSLVRITNICL